MSTPQPKTTRAVARSLQLYSKSHVISFCEARMEKPFQSRGCSRTPPPPEQPQGHFPQITGQQGRVITKTARETRAGSRSMLYLGIASSARTRPPPTRWVNQQSRQQDKHCHCAPRAFLPFPTTHSPTWLPSLASWAQAGAVARHSTEWPRCGRGKDRVASSAAPQGADRPLTLGAHPAPAWPQVTVSHCTAAKGQNSLRAGTVSAP